MNLLPLLNQMRDRSENPVTDLDKLVKRHGAVRMASKRFRIAFHATWIVTLLAHSAEAELRTSTVEIVKVYPHDTGAFTEGLFFRDGLLYESTGGEGQSTIRAIDLASGHVLRTITLPPGVFGEGIVDWNNEIVSVTWHGGRGFRWSLRTFQRIGEFHYDGEGWALTQDGQDIILSDGTPVLRFLDPKTLRVVRRIRVLAEGRPVERLNELEYVRGEILANVWLTNRIARIDPRSGAVRGWIDIGAVAARINSHDPDAVANGIAYDAAQDRLFITGKDWPWLFEVRVKP